MYWRPIVNEPNKEGDYLVLSPGNIYSIASWHPEKGWRGEFCDDIIYWTQLLPPPPITPVATIHYIPPEDRERWTG